MKLAEGARESGGREAWEARPCLGGQGRRTGTTSLEPEGSMGPDTALQTIASRLWVPMAPSLACRTQPAALLHRAGDRSLEGSWERRHGGCGLAGAAHLYSQCPCDMSPWTRVPTPGP